VENIVGSVRPQMAVLRMRIACWIPKDKNTRFECVILTDFPLNNKKVKGKVIPLQDRCGPEGG